MKRMLTILTILLAAALPTLRVTAQCTAENTAFQSGETLVYDLYFNWKFVWVKAGSASMTITGTTYDGQDAYRCNLITRGNKRVDKFFVMRDTLVSVVNTGLAPLYYRKGALEGERYKVDEVWYRYTDGKTHIRQRYRNHRAQVSVQNRVSASCIYDMLSMLLRARSFDGNAYKKGDKIRFLMADGDEVEEQTLVFRGHDKFQMENTGTTYRCLVFSFVEYEGKKEKEIITFYVTDDANHLPVRLDMYLRFGTAKAFLTGSRGVRNPLTSIIK